MRLMAKKIFMFLFVVSISFLIVGGCGNDDDNSNGGGGEVVLSCPVLNLSIEVCDPESGPFTLDIDNDFFPLVVGSSSVLEGTDDEGAFIRVEIDVLDETEVVAGVTTRVVTETEFEDGELVEISRNFFAQAPDGTVCYFGEDVDIFEDGEVVSNDGAWRAGENGNLPGIFLPGDPQVGDSFSQEVAPGIAEDQAEIIAFGETLTVPAGEFQDTMTVEDCDPLDEEITIEEKVYVRGIGLALDETIELISFE